MSAEMRAIWKERPFSGDISWSSDLHGLLKASPTISALGISSAWVPRPPPEFAVFNNINCGQGTVALASSIISADLFIAYSPPPPILTPIVAFGDSMYFTFISQVLVAVPPNEYVFSTTSVRM